MRKIILAVLGLVLVCGTAGAADVADRTDCTALKTEMDALAKIDSPDSDTAEKLAGLQATYRAKCSKRAGARASRTIAKTRGANDAAPTKEADDADAPVIADGCDNPDANGCCPGEEFADMGDAGKYCCKDDVCFPPMDVAPVVSAAPVAPQKSEEEIAAEIAANIEKGLCGDGTKPNKYGCCTGELFKDLGNNEFACCKKDTNECFPPMK